MRLGNYLTYVRITEGRNAGKVYKTFSNAKGLYIKNGRSSDLVSEGTYEDVLTDGFPYGDGVPHVFVKSLVTNEYLKEDWTYLVKGNMWGDERVDIYTPDYVYSEHKDNLKLVGGTKVQMQMGDSFCGIYNHGGDDYMMMSSKNNPAQYLNIDSDLAKIMLKGLNAYV